MKLDQLIKKYLKDQDKQNANTTGKEKPADGWMFISLHVN